MNQYVRPYKLAHQVLSINQINFQKRSYIGVTELHVISQRPDLRTVKLNCRQCKVFQIMVNSLYECAYTYHDPLLELCAPDARHRTLDALTASHLEAVVATDAEKNFGEIIIQIPKQLFNYVAEGRTLVFNIEFGVERPSGGIHFVVPEGGCRQLRVSHDKIEFRILILNSNLKQRLCPTPSPRRIGGAAGREDDAPVHLLEREQLAPVVPVDRLAQ